jgi:hypothetical protein
VTTYRLETHSGLPVRLALSAEGRSGNPHFGQRITSESVSKAEHCARNASNMTAILHTTERDWQAAASTHQRENEHAPNWCCLVYAFSKLSRARGMDRACSGADHDDWPVTQACAVLHCAVIFGASYVFRSTSLDGADKFECNQIVSSGNQRETDRN